MNNKSEAWDIAYPAIIFLLQARNLPPTGWETLQRAVDHASKEVVQEEEKEPTEQELKDMGLSDCEQCGETAWDGRICHVCGMKEI